MSEVVASGSVEAQLALPTQDDVDALQRHDSAAWTVVVRWLQPQLDGFFAAGRAPDPEGLTQEVFCKLARNIAQFTSGGPDELRSWAFAIARTTRIDEARRASVRPQTIPDSARDSSGAAGTAAAAADNAAPPDEQIASLDRVAELLGRLTDSQAELLRLRILGDLTLEQAARIVGLDVNAAKQLQRRALRKLASMLDEAGDDLPPAGADHADSREPGGIRTSGTPP